MFGGKPWLVLPPGAAKEFISKSDADLDADLIHIEQLQVKYTLGHKGIHIMKRPLQFDVLRRQVTRKLPQLTNSVYEELDLGFKQYWGANTKDWTEVEAFPTCLRLVTRAANRVFAGSEICRDERFLEHSKLYTQSVVFVAMALRLVPNFLRPVIAPLLTIRSNMHFRICLNICGPVINSRIRNTKEKLENPSYNWEPPVRALKHHKTVFFADGN